MYSAIWQTELKANSEELRQEFESSFGGGLSTIYQGNDNWTGVCVFDPGKVNKLNDLPMLKKYLQQFGEKNVIGVGYFNLEAKADLHRHRDMNGNLLFGVIRLHIPLKTNPQAVLEVQKKPYHLPLNTVWALDTSAIHALWNKGDSNRVHLVIDIKKGPETAQYFPKMNFGVFAHLAEFVIVMSFKIVRDIITKPKSIIHRIQSFIGKRANS